MNLSNLITSLRLRLAALLVPSLRQMPSPAEHEKLRQALRELLGIVDKLEADNLNLALTARNASCLALKLMEKSNPQAPNVSRLGAVPNPNTGVPSPQAAPPGA